MTFLFPALSCKPNEYYVKFACFFNNESGSATVRTAASVVKFLVGNGILILDIFKLTL